VNRARAALGALAGVTAFACAAPAEAPAALTFSPCSFRGVAGCARVTVPLDRSGGLPGTIALQVERFQTARVAAPGVLLAIAGGPGQAGTPVFDEPYLDAFGPALATRDFVTFDLRGTGRSGALRCPVLERAPIGDETSAAAACATSLGPARAHYTTRDTVEDIEAVRQALAVDRLTLYGISYGSKVAEAYAMRYPERVDRMVLDAVLPPDGPDPLYRETFAAIPRSLRALCRGGACRSIASDPARDLVRLSARLGRGRLRGTLIAGNGRAQRVSLDREDLFRVLLRGDLAAGVRAGIPAALRSALRGDPAPLLRLAGPPASRARAAALVADSRALFAATECEESTFPWDRSAALGDRPAQLRATLARLGPAPFAPFDAATAVRAEYINLCSRWPQDPMPPTLQGTPPSVPTLLLDGENDLRTPLEGARRLAAALPQSTLVAVPATGHGSLPSPPRCAKRALAQFLAGARVSARCSFGAPPRALMPWPRSPTALRRVALQRGSSGASGRTLAAVALTLDDLDRYARAISAPPGTSLGGLRGGFARLRSAGGISLTRLEFVPGVLVTGSLTGSGGVLRISGRAASAGRLSVTRDGRIAGVLGGRMVRGRGGAGLESLVS
jgi:pimeloyl-ACP methyl ester carboxylesterase